MDALNTKLAAAVAAVSTARAGYSAAVLAHQEGTTNAPALQKVAKDLDAAERLVIELRAAITATEVRQQERQAAGAEAVARAGRSSRGH
jgi:hypothetical protein